MIGIWFCKFRRRGLRRPYPGAISYSATRRILIAERLSSMTSDSNLRLFSADIEEWRYLMKKPKLFKSINLCKRAHGETTLIDFFKQIAVIGSTRNLTRVLRRSYPVNSDNI